MKLKRPDVVVPEKMRTLPMTELGYFKPWFVKDDDFRVVDLQKAHRARAKEVCWISGQPFPEKRYALVGSPLSAMTLVFREPPCIVECAEYAVQVCPFILYPNSKRRVSGLKESDTIEYFNDRLDVKYDGSNPGEYYIVVVDDFWFHEKTQTIRCEETNVIERQYWIEGKRQETVPHPIVSYSMLPDVTRKNLSEEEFTAKYVLRDKKYDFRPVSFEDFGNLYWIENLKYSYVANQNYLVIGPEELSRLGSSFPIAFIEIRGELMPAAIFSLLPGRNLFVDSDMNWSHSVVPRAYRLFPFRLGGTTTSEKLLCIDTSFKSIVSAEVAQSESSGALVSPFYETEDKLSAGTRKIYDELLNLSKDITHGKALVEDLNNYGLLKPWSIKLHLESSGKSKSIQGLQCIDQQVFNSMSADQKQILERSGAYKLAKEQLDSMKNLAQIHHRMNH